MRCPVFEENQRLVNTSNVPYQLPVMVSEDSLLHDSAPLPFSILRIHFYHNFEIFSKVDIQSLYIFFKGLHSYDFVAIVPLLSQVVCDHYIYCPLQIFVFPGINNCFFFSICLVLCTYCAISSNTPTDP